MITIGRGVREIRIRADDGAFRVAYAAMLGDVVYVLHCFQKSTQKTAKRDIDLAAKRYGELLRELRHER